MNSKETAVILGVLRVAYPNTYKNIDKATANATVALWQDILGEYPYEVVEGVVKAYIAGGNEFPPTVGQINVQIKKMTAPQLMTPEEAWALVAKAVDYYDYHKNFKKLPEDVQKVLGDARQLKDWSLIDSPVSWQVVASNFMKSYAMHQERVKEQVMLPENIKQKLQSIKFLSEGSNNGNTI